MKLVEYWWIIWWRRASTWLAALFAAVTTAVVAYPSLLLGLLAYFPDGYRAFLAGAVFVIMFAVPVVVALVKQPKLRAKVQEAKDASSD